MHFNLKLVFHSLVIHRKFIHNKKIKLINSNVFVIIKDEILPHRQLACCVANSAIVLAKDY